VCVYVTSQTAEVVKDTAENIYLCPSVIAEGTKARNKEILSFHSSWYYYLYIRKLLSLSLY